MQMDSNRKKELQSQYADREVVGGVYLIRNTFNNKILLETTTDLNVCKNRFEFAQKTGSCVYPKLQKDWAEQGGDQFILEVLEELKKGETQSQTEFKADIEFLKEIWREKLSAEGYY